MVDPVGATQVVIDRVRDQIEERSAVAILTLSGPEP